MPELCRRLTEATGVTHHVDGRLRDYPVFLSVHGSDAKRVESLLATVLGGEWQRDGKALVLTPVRPKGEEGLAEFERQFRLATGGQKDLAALPMKALYEMAPGSQARFGSPAGALFLPFMPGFTKTGRIVVRRDAYGSFSFRQDFGDRQSGVFTPGGQIQFGSLPPEVLAHLGEDAKKPGLSKTEGEAVFKSMTDPSTLKVDWKSLDRSDPIAAFNEPVLSSVAAKVAPDLVVALPDLSLMNLPAASHGATVEATCGAYALAVAWRFGDGAILGTLPDCERLAPAQTRRAVLSGFVQNAQRNGVPTPNDLASYLADQRPGASDTWSDVMLIVMSGVVVDQSFIGDHPYNLRFGRSLSDDDWRLVGVGRPFSAASLSAAARAALMAVLLQSRERLETGKPDPATWPSLSSDRLVVTPETNGDEVVIAYGGFSADVYEPQRALSNLPQRKKELGREPLYRPARRRQIKFRIAPAGADELGVTTGFAEVMPDPGTKPTVWAELPEAIRKAAGNGVEAAPPVAAP